MAPLERILALLIEAERVFASPRLVGYFGLGALVWLLCRRILPRLAPHRKIRADRPPKWQYLTEFLTSTRMILVSTLIMVIFIYVAGPFLASRFGEIPRFREPLWILASFFMTLVAHDTYFYWTHRLMHQPILFRALHLRHHRSYNPTPFSAYSFSFGEALVQSMFLPLWLLLTPTPPGIAFAELMFQVVHNMIDHSGYEVFPADRLRRPLFDWFKTVTHHDLHHEQGGNYALFFTWWDRAMGTEHPDYHARFAQTVVGGERPAPAAPTVS